MIPQTQTITGRRDGDCLRASLASVMELNVLDVPHFVGVCLDCKESCVETECYKWHYLLADFLKSKGYSLSWTQDLSILDHIPDDYPFEDFFVVIFTSGDDNCHAVVAQGDRLVHDPHPDATGYVGIRVSRLNSAQVLLMRYKS